jgi:hypothetical protein
MWSFKSEWFYYRIYLNARWGFFPCIWCLNLWGLLKFMYEAPNQISLNRIMWSHTKACIAKSSREICVVLWYYTVEWEFLTDVSGQPIGPILKGQEIQKWEHCRTQVNWRNLLFWGFHPLSIPPPQEARCFISWLCFVESSKEACNLVDLDWVIVNQWAPMKW